ncbi:MAG: globin-coupled sensor protein [Caulobacteraceae bacterium]
MANSDQLHRRLAFSKIDEDAKRALRKLGPTIGKSASGALDAFYDQVRAYEEVSRFFADEAQIGKAKDRQVRHWQRLASGELDETYVRDVRAVGEVHARIGLEPRWYIGGYGLILETLIRAVVNEQRSGGRLFGGSAHRDDLADGLGALVKVAMIDMDFAISTYLEALEAERARQEAARLEAEAHQRHVVEVLAAALAKLAAGDLVFRIADPFAPEYEQLRCDYNAAMAKVEEALSVISETTTTLRSGAGEITLATDDLSRRTEHQAASLEETAAALGEITVTVKRTAAGTAQASAVVRAARTDAEESGRVVGDAVQAMVGIEESSRQISQIIGVIDEIAFQTNLLALNAGVEAARAGDAGRGFAVVASEVRALAQRSAEAAKEIKVLISASTEYVTAGVGLVGDAGAALKRIAGQVSEIDTVVGEISASAQAQAASLNQVNAAINTMDQVTQQNAAMVQQTTAASHGLAADAERLSDQVGRFRITPGAAPSASPWKPQVVATTISDAPPPPRSRARR